MTQRPLTVDLACRLLWLLVAAGLVVSVLVVVFRNHLDEVWAPMQAGDSTVQPIEYLPVILVLYGVIAITTATLIAIFRHGHLWAQHGLAVICIGIVVSCLATMRTDLPMEFRIAAMAAGVLAAIAVVFLWHPATTRFVWGRDDS